MRHLSLLLCTLVGAVALSVPSLALHAKPAHAVASACNGAESEETVYQDSVYPHKSTLVSDSYPLGPPTHWVDTDLKPYHVGSSGFCFRAYYVSTWTEDGTTANFRPFIRAWVCGSGPYQFTSGEAAVANRYAMTDGSWGRDIWIRRTVVLWDGSTYAATFANYGTAGNVCGYQADNYGSYANTTTWYNPSAVFADPSNTYWYVNV